MLCFNPDMRWSASDCLNSSYFDSVRKPELEVGAPYKIHLTIDADDAFNYESSKSEKFKEKDIIEAIRLEILDIKKYK